MGRFILFGRLAVVFAIILFSFSAAAEGSESVPLEASEDLPVVEAGSISQTSIDNAATLQIGNGLLQFLVSHAQAVFEKKYPEILHVDVSNPMEFNELAFSDEDYIDFIGLDDGGVNVAKHDVSDDIVGTGPLYIPCPALDEAFGDWTVSEANDEHKKDEPHPFAGKRGPGDPDYNPMGCQYALTFVNNGDWTSQSYSSARVLPPNIDTNGSGGGSAGGTSAEGQFDLYFAVENLHWDFDVSGLSPRLVNKTDTIEDLVDATTSVETTTTTTTTGYSIDVAPDGHKWTGTTPITSTTTTEELVAAFDGYESSEQQFLETSGEVVLDLSFQLVLRVSCGTTDGKCPDWFGDIASNYQDLSDGDTGMSETKDGIKSFTVRVPVSLDGIKPDLWAQSSIQDGQLELSHLYLESYKLDGFDWDAVIATDFASGLAEALIENTTITDDGWSVGGIVRGALSILSAIIPGEDDVYDVLSNGLQWVLSIIVDGADPIFTQMANNALGAEVQGVMLGDLNFFTTLPLAGHVALAPTRLVHLSTEDASTNVELAVSTLRNLLQDSCMSGVWPEFSKPSGKFSAEAVDEDTDLVLGLSTQAVVSAMDTALYNEDWCAEIQNDIAINPYQIVSSAGGLANSQTGIPTTIYPEFSGTLELTTNAWMSAYPEFSWQEQGKTQSTASRSKTAARSTSAEDSAAEAMESVSTDTSQNVVAVLTFSGMEKDKMPLHGHVSLTNDGQEIFSADYSGGFTASIGISTDSDGKQTLELADIEWANAWDFSHIKYLNKRVKKILTEQITKVTEAVQARLETSLKDSLQAEIPTDYSAHGLSACLGEMSLDGDYALMPIRLAEAGHCDDTTDEDSDGTAIDPPNGGYQIPFDDSTFKDPNEILAHPAEMLSNEPISSDE